MHRAIYRSAVATIAILPWIAAFAGAKARAKTSRLGEAVGGLELFQCLRASYAGQRHLDDS